MLAKVIKTTAVAYTNLMIGQVPSMIGIGPRVDLELPKPTAVAVGIYFELAKHRKE
ncbi:MAG: hypothetical protein HY665_05905 [Chloroflexi bacterium]|nr:hypothetical protein [Chloroflexota bacterium]